jgi:hypothetical protein
MSYVYLLKQKTIDEDEEKNKRLSDWEKWLHKSPKVCECEA